MPRIARTAKEPSEAELPRVGPINLSGLWVENREGKNLRTTGMVQGGINRRKMMGWTSKVP